MQDYIKNPIEFLKATIPAFKTKTHGKITRLNCPVCHNDSAVLIPNSNGTMKCNHVKCHFHGNLIDALRKTKYPNNNVTDEKIITEIASQLGQEVKEEELVPVDEVSSILDMFEKYKFDLVPVAKDKKRPIEKDWTNKNHLERSEWEDWLDMGINIGIKTGSISGITVIDLDSQTIPEELKEYFDKTLVQKTQKGYHLFFKYTNLPKTYVELLVQDEKVRIDIENDGGQVLAFPSIVEGKGRKFICKEQIIDMPESLLSFFKTKLKKTPKKSSEDTKIETDLKLEGIDTSEFEVIGKGNRHTSLIKLGGSLRHRFNAEDTRYILTAINDKFCNPSLESTELTHIISMLSKYTNFDQEALAAKIHEYLNLDSIPDASSRDIAEYLREKKPSVDKALSHLVKEGYVIPKRGSRYSSIKKVLWKDDFTKIDNKCNYTFPYFDNYAQINYGDMILFGGKTGTGKTTIAMNVIKHFVDQGIKPRYCYFETGGRYQKTAAKLGMVGSDFWHGHVTNPTEVELEKDSVTILDWLLVQDKAQTDTIFQYYSRQLEKNGGVLIIFMQLKQNDEWFAPNMVDQFASVAARYVYDKDDQGKDNYEKGSWFTDKIRDPKTRNKKPNIPCQYDFETGVHSEVKIK